MEASFKFRNFEGAAGRSWPEPSSRAALDFVPERTTFPDPELWAAARRPDTSFEPAGDCALRKWGEGLPLALFHGGLGSWRHWVANIPCLAGQFQVLAVDLPGFGSAASVHAAAGGIYLDSVLRSFRLIVERYGPVHLAAFGFGAALAGKVARRLPAGVRALTLLSPGGLSDECGGSLDLRGVPSRSNDVGAHRAALAHNLGQLMTTNAPEPDDAIVDIQMINVAQLRFDGCKVSQRARLLEDLAETSAPLQVIWGRKDRLIAPDTIEMRMSRLCAARPDAEICVLPHGAHWIQFEQSATVNALLIDFHTREQA